jgi:hypothetical protein
VKTKELQSFISVRCLSDHLHIRLSVDLTRNARHHERMVIDSQDFDARLSVMVTPGLTSGNELVSTLDVSSSYLPVSILA